MVSVANYLTHGKTLGSFDSHVAPIGNHLLGTRTQDDNDMQATVLEEMLQMHDLKLLAAKNM